MTIRVKNKKRWKRRGQEPLHVKENKARNLVLIIHRITVQITCYFNCGRSGSVSETLRSTISLYGYGKITWPVTSHKYGQTTLRRRKSCAKGCNNDLIAPAGTPGLISVEYKSKNLLSSLQQLKESLDQKLNLKIPLLNCWILKNSLRQNRIPETIKLGNKNNNQDINALLKIHSPKALITLNAQINAPLHPPPLK